MLKVNLALDFEWYSIGFSGQQKVQQLFCDCRSEPEASKGELAVS
jgi:hypothetical protein